MELKSAISNTCLYLFIISACIYIPLFEGRTLGLVICSFTNFLFHSHAKKFSRTSCWKELETDRNCIFHFWPKTKLAPKLTFWLGRKRKRNCIASFGRKRN